MANAQLIQMAREIGKSKGFVDTGKEFEKSFGKWVGMAEETLKVRRDKRAEGTARVVDFMSKMPSHQSLPKIPAYAQEKVGAWLKEQRKVYGDNARAIRDLDPTSEEYQSHVNTMNKITQSMSNLNDQFDTLLEDKVSYMENVDKGQISNGTSAEAHNELSKVYTDATELGISEDGRLDFGGKSFDDLPKWFPKNDAIPMALTTLNAKYYKNAQEITGALGTNLKMQVEQIIKGAGRNGVMSLAADYENGVLQIEEDLISNPARHEELIDKMVNTWVSAITESAKIGKEQSDADWKMKHPKNTTPAQYGLDRFFFKTIDAKN